MSETPEQASLRMKAGAKTGARGEVPVEVPIRAVRAWLESEPESLAVTHYAQWVKQENRKLPEPERYPTPPGVIKVLLLSWEKAIEVSRPGSKLDVATARHAYLAELKAKSVAEHRVGSGAEGLCNMTGVALVLGQTRNRVRQDFRKGLLPPHVAVWSSSPVWYWSDVEGRAHGQPDPDRPAGGLQDELLNSVKLAARLKRTTKTLGLALSAASPTVPPPAGRIGRDAYWLKSEVEPWLAEHRHLIGASPAELARWTKAVKRAR